MSKFLLEIGTEELPANFANEARVQFKELGEKWLKDNNISFSEVKSYSTPRRLVLMVENISEKQPDLEKEVKGPPVNNAYDSNGNPTKALEGFCKSQGVSLEQLEKKEIKGNLFIFATVKQVGKASAELLPGLVSHLISSLSVARSMRWGDNSLKFSRPLHWVLALLDNKVIDLNLENLKSGNYSYGHRFLSNGKIIITHPDMYLDELKNNHVIVDNEARKKLIAEQLENAASEYNAKVRIDEGLLNEVNQLVEFPAAIVGSFEQKYLQVPDVVSVTVMKSHQRYFPMFSSDGKLMPNFITISNMNINPENIRKGNEKVLRARLEDGIFYYNEDVKASLEQNLDELKRVTYFEEIGSIYDKEERMEQIADYLYKNYFSDNGFNLQDAKKAVRLSKTDLVTYMVQEFTELQGEIGYYYALKEGIDENIAYALKEQYLPTGNNEELPSRPISQIVNFSDKLDNIISCFSLGKIPTGSKDPFALRRQALGIIRTSDKYKIPLNVNDLFGQAWDTLYVQKKITPNKNETVAKIKEFFIQRLRNDLIDRGYRYDLVDAVLNTEEALKDLYAVQEKVRVLSAWVQENNVNDTIMALARIIRICKIEIPDTVNENLFEKEEERNLYTALSSIKDKLYALYQDYNFSEYLKTLETLVVPVNNFFDHVMVMVENTEVKANRLALLQGIKNVSDKIANIDKVII